MMKWRAWGMAVALAIGVPAAALAQGVIQSITSSQQSGSEVVRIELSEALTAVPAGFAIQAPPRIAIDLPGVGSALARPSVELNQGNLRSVNVAQAGDRTRLVLNLKQAATYRAQLDGKALLIIVDTGAPAAATVAAAPVGGAPAGNFAPVQAREQQPLRDIDFRRGVDGAGRVIVSLPSSQVGVDIRQQGTGLVVEFLRAAVPDSLRRRLDVTDFGTPVQTVTTSQIGDRVRMVVEPRGNWEHSAYQSDNQFVLEVRPVRVDPNKLTQGPGYQGEKLSLNFQNIEVRSLLQVIADFTNFNVVTSDTVTGNLTLRLKDVPWDQALDIILQSKGLSKRKNGNVVLIAPTDELAAKEKLLLESSNQISELEPLRTESYALSYAKAEDLRKLLSDKDQKILSKRGNANLDERTNTLFVQDVPVRLEEVRKLVAQLDIAVRQVMIEARIVIADDKWSRSLGARFGIQAGYNRGNTNVGTSGTPYNTVSPLANNPTSPGSTNIATGSLSPQGGQPEQLNVNLPVAGAAGQLALTFLNLGSGNLVNLELSALEADNRGKVISNPRVITADKKRAVISQGTEIPYQTSSASGATTVAFKPAVLELAVTPRITPDDKIILDLEVKKDSVGALINAGSAGTIPSIDTKRVTTQVLVDNGETAVLGGIFEQTTRTTVNKVPLLGDIPIFGYLFKRTDKVDDKTELLIFITPKIIKEGVALR